jgi:prevent-host-death family protein
MPTVGLKALKNHLSEYVRRAAAGETVTITDRSRVVARLVPPQASRGLTLFEEEGIREGWLRPAANPHTPLPPRQPLVPFDQLMRELDEDREDC